jgi:hypothetical protein
LAKRSQQDPGTVKPLRERPPENEISSAPLDLARLKALLRQPVVVDLRNIYRPDEMARHGFTYVSVGRPSDPATP